MEIPRSENQYIEFKSETGCETSGKTPLSRYSFSRVIG